ncbi:thioesterase II family protein [Bacillus thuringiensis]|uniref:Thioesterase n=1 Tax=Bacillus thuringiensis TaxID=1428 RepID=A0A9X7BKM4_BACTU|nr:thioesterase domain-containing protein [Bacillus thuringiensis]MED4445710.1 thioesterase domain-containing protein [Bacillus cereus]PEB44118.1 putative thioesterase [Bacillus thuringiensis]PED24998.1 putative thioesterase [Bacillus thuringiensis]PFL11131.1 putative thioesterase [Bacillus thuringiensis]PFV27995.1 putative thioesterase [Bacillus thuringiensis]
MILFCLPYAGGSRAIYHDWKNHLHPSIQIVPIELKGRGQRFLEVFYESLEEAVDDIFENIKDKIRNDDFAIYGHSMGGLLAFELYYKLSKLNSNKPKHIFFSGYRAPSVIRERENIYTLPDYEFMKKVMELGGTSEELMKNKDLLEIYLPIIRSDFMITETYNYEEREEKIACDISILNGKQDTTNLKDILTWKNHGCGEFKVYNLEGNHFFINNNVENITSIINTTLLDKNHHI